MTDPRTFDGTAGVRADDLYAMPPAQPEPAPFSSLDALRAAMDVREAAPTPNDVRVPVPGLGIRLVCSPAFSYPQYRDWQKTGLPADQRKGRKQPNGIDMDRTTVALLVLTNTCEGLEMETPPGSGTWVPMTDSGGNPYTLNDTEFLSRFNMMDPKSMLRKLFTVPGRAPDAELIKASDIVVNAAGYGDGDPDGEDSDPNS